MCCLCVAPDTLFIINAIAIIESLRDSDNKLKQNGWQSAISDFLFAKIVLCYPCVIIYILFYTRGAAILHCF